MDTLLCNDDGDIVFFGAPSATDEILAFHYGNFDNAYGDGTVGAAAANGRVYADTVPGTLPAEFGSIGTPTTASGQTTYTWTPPPTSLQANVLLVAGGGTGGNNKAGGYENGGGGGAGGVVYKTGETISGQQTIVVGQGGIIPVGNGQNTGKNTTAFGYTALGGGGGSTRDSQTNINGGSGGGAVNWNPHTTNGQATQPGSVSGGFGNDGGTATQVASTNGGSAGGGGASQAGFNGSGTTGADGGAGFLASVFGEIYGESGWFAGGGAGGGGVGGLGGVGGGGVAGSSSSVNGTNGTAHTGGGGGGNFASTGNAGNGGSGIVLVRYIVDTAVITNEETLAFLYAGSGTETTYTWDAEGVTYADVLIVGGGGGGRTAPGTHTPGGGGGGGEVVLRRGVAVTPGVEIKVGRGGPVNTQGGISQFTSSIQANGGGSGGSGSGGSGGGANRGSTTSGTSVKLSVDGMGNVGGYTTSTGAGGGGGATQAGFIGSSDNGTNGGEGYIATVFGVWNTVYGSGGGGGARIGGGGTGGTNAGNGGNHSTSVNGNPGLVHTGSAGGGAGAGGVGGTGAPGGSGIVLVKPNPGALDGLGTTIYTQAVGAYALRRLFGAYTGAQVRLRRSTDNAEVDVTFDKYGHPVNFDLTTWIGAATAYVKTWYDQSGNGNNVTQATTSKQPKYDTTNKIEFIASSQHSLLRTPGVLAAGDDTYTFAGVFEPHTTGSTQVVCEQNSSTSISSQRACVILLSSKIGHNGQSNDAHNIVAYTLNQKNRFVMRVNNGVSPNIKLNHEGTNYTATSTSRANLNVSGYGFSIGYKLSTNTEYFDGFISEIIVFNTEISDTETNTIISLSQ
jgi:hypothetical protein